MYVYNYSEIYQQNYCPLKKSYETNVNRILCGIFISGELFFTESSKSANYSATTRYILAGLFLLFEFFNFQCHVTLRNLRVGSNSKKRGIPRVRILYMAWDIIYNRVGALTRFPALTISGKLAAGPLLLLWLDATHVRDIHRKMVLLDVAYLFLFVSFAQMTQWALKKHRQYRKEFDGKEGREAYPR